jgi:hypothetical protein
MDLLTQLQHFFITWFVLFVVWDWMLDVTEYQQRQVEATESIRSTLEEALSKGVDEEAWRKLEPEIMRNVLTK